MRRSIIIAIMCLALSTQALAWTAMPCCNGAGAATRTAAHDMDGHGMGDMQSHCGDDGDAGADQDLTPGNCCSGTACGSASAIPSAIVKLDPQVWSTEFSGLTRVQPNAPGERFLRPPIALI